VSTLPLESSVTTTAAPPVGATRRSVRERFAQLSPFETLGWGVGLVLVVLATYPLLRVLMRLFWVDGALTLDPIRNTLAEPDLVELMFNTMVVVLASGVLALFGGAILAWLNERTDARMGPLTDSLPLVPFLLPPVAGAIGWVLLTSPGAGYINVGIRNLAGMVGIDIATGPLDIYSWYGLIFIFVVYQVPFVFLLVSAGLRSMDTGLEEQSRVCGSGVLRTIRKVTLPALMPSLGGAVLLMAWQGFALFSLPAIIGGPAGIELLSVRIVRVLTFTFPPQTDIAVGLSAIVVLFVGVTWYLQTRLLRSGKYATIGGKGQDLSRFELGKWRWPVRALMLSYVVIAAVLPIAALVIVALNGFWSPSIRWGQLSFDTIQRTVFDNPLTFRALGNSLRLGVTGATIGMVAAALVAVVVVRSQRKAGRWVDAGIKMPASISNIVLAVGFLLAFAGNPFNLRGTFLILLLGYIALYLPQGSVAADTAAGQVGSELSEASQVSGARKGRTFWKVQLPLMIPGLVAGWALLFARMTGDLTASAILSGTRNPVVGFRILDVYQNGSYAEVASLSTVLVVVTGVVIAVTMGWARRRSKWGTSVGVGGL
jgi:iron(III) transport system permease protein